MFENENTRKEPTGGLDIIEGNLRWAHAKFLNGNNFRAHLLGHPTGIVNKRPFVLS